MFRVRANQAYLTHDTDFLDRMDPYLVLYYGGQRKQSTVREEAGRNPRWGDSFIFTRTSDPIIRVQVWDKDTFSPDDLVGQGQVNVLAALNGPPGFPVEVPVDLFYQGRNAGRVSLSIANEGGIGGVFQPQLSIGNPWGQQPSFGQQLYGQPNYGQPNYGQAAFGSPGYGSGW